MSRFASGLNVGHVLVALCQESGARSGLIQCGGKFVESNLAMAEGRASEIVEVISEMVTSYQEVGRTVESAFFGFGENLLLIVSEGELAVSLIFPAAFDQVVEATAQCRSFLRENRASILLSSSSLKPGENVTADSEPMGAPVKAWDTFRPLLKGLLNRVIMGTQAERIIDNLLISKNLAEHGPDDSEVAEVSREVIMKVGHRGKQQALLAELKDLLAEAGLE